MRLDGFNFNLHSLRDWCRQEQLVPTAYRDSVDGVRNILRKKCVADINPLISRFIYDFPYHPRISRRSLRILLIVCIEVSSDANLKENMQSVQQNSLDWEGDLARRFHISEKIFSDQEWDAWISYLGFRLRNLYPIHDGRQHSSDLLVNLYTAISISKRKKNKYLWWWNMIS